MFIQIIFHSRKVLPSILSFEKVLTTPIHSYRQQSIFGNKALKEIHQHLIMYLIMISRRNPLLYQ
ncbi:hypothetical protein [Endozoicomonas elysicola]|uniref:Uncharacterized protein n=1 Tax=Endozoicomonas elysicola TaxID=305900 RepID=A0A081KGU7_9GAMM|nr:hypothetical protein [Endozoicomonas elysicola]KEI73373.1 hypothetical protein GV64_23980 [Endozoicomonas elysicola]